MIDKINFTGTVHLSKAVEKTIQEKAFMDIAKAFKQSAQDVFVTRVNSITRPDKADRRYFLSFYKLPENTKSYKLTAENLPKGATYHSEEIKVV